MDGSSKTLKFSMIIAIDECKVGLGKLKDMANHFALIVYISKISISSFDL